MRHLVIRGFSRSKQSSSGAIYPFYLFQKNLPIKGSNSILLRRRLVRYHLGNSNFERSHNFGVFIFDNKPSFLVDNLGPLTSDDIVAPHLTVMPVVIPVFRRLT